MILTGGVLRCSNISLNLLGIIFDTYRRGAALFKQESESVGGDLVVTDPLPHAPHVVLVQGPVQHHLDLTCKNKIHSHIQLFSTAV